MDADDQNLTFLTNSSVFSPADDTSLSPPIQRLMLIVYMALTLAYSAYAAIVLHSIHHLSPCPPQALAIGHVAAAELLYILLALITTFIGTLAPTRLPANWSHFLVSLKSWMAVVSMIGQSAKALEAYWFIVYPLHYTDALVGRVAGVVAPCSWLLALLLSVGAMVCLDDHGPRIFQYTMMLCEHPRNLQGYLAQGLVFGLSLATMVFSCVTVLWTTYKHINMDKEVRKIRVQLIRPIHESSSVAEVEGAEPEAGPSGMTASKTCNSLDDRLGAIPENAEELSNEVTKECAKESYPELYVRPAGPSRMQRGSVISRSRLHSVDSIEMLNQLDHNECLRKMSTTARHGSPRDFRYGRPVELYFRISTCTTVGNDNHESPENSPLENPANISGGPDIVPRIEVISPTTAGCRSSQPSTVVSEYSVPSSDTNTPDPQGPSKSTCGIQTTLDDVKSDVTPAWEGAEEGGQAEADDTKKEDNNAGSPGQTSEVMDFKISCSVRDLTNATTNENSVSMDADVSCTVNSQGSGSANGKRSLDTETSFRINGHRTSECSVKAQVEINASSPSPGSRKEDHKDRSFDFKPKSKDDDSTRKSVTTSVQDKENPAIATLNQENLSKFNKSFNDVSSLNSVPITIKPTRSKSFSDKFSWTNNMSQKKSCNCQPQEWTVHYNNRLSQESAHSINNNEPVQTKLSITRQLTIKDLLADDGSITSMQDALSPLNEQCPSYIARRRKVMSFCKVVTKTLLYLLQWLPIGVYIIWGSLQREAPTSAAWHFGIQLACQWCVILGSGLGLAMYVRNCEELKKAMRVIIHCHLAQVAPVDLQSPQDEDHGRAGGGGLPI